MNVTDTLTKGGVFAPYFEPAVNCVAGVVYEAGDAPSPLELY